MKKKESHVCKIVLIRLGCLETYNINVVTQGPDDIYK